MQDYVYCTKRILNIFIIILWKMLNNRTEINKFEAKTTLIFLSVRFTQNKKK